MITEYAMDSCATIAFHNNTHTPPTLVVWVCEDKDAYEAALVKLRAMDHVSIVQHGASHIERAK